MPAKRPKKVIRKKPVKAVKPAETVNLPRTPMRGIITSFHKQFAVDPIDGVTRSLFDMVDEWMQSYSRGHMVRVLGALFEVGAGTIDRCIADVKAEWAEEMKKTRAERVDKAMKRLDSLHRRAKNRGDLMAERAAIETQAKFTGDTAPEVHVVLGGGMTPEAAQEEADRLRKLMQDAE